MQRKNFLPQSKSRFFKTAAKVLCIFLMAAVFLLALPALAATLETGLEYAKGIGLGTQDLRITAAKIIRAILGFLGIVAVALIMYGGFRYMTSAGNPEKVQEARKVLINTAIGLLIILTAFAITQFILSYLLWATGAGRMPAGPPPYGGGGGALGAG